LTGTICLAVCMKSFNEFEEFLWNRHCLYYFFVFAGERFFSRSSNLPSMAASRSLI
jgi:hypothetical protein